MGKKIVLILLLLISCVVGYRIFQVNLRYPSPKIWTGGLQDTILAGNYRITFSNWQWADGALLQELCPGYCMFVDENGMGYPTERERVGLITLRVEKQKEDGSILDLTDMAFESGAWGNQFDMELMYLLNPQLEGLSLQMEEGECRDIIFPMIMSDLQFAQSAWERIDEREFYMVLAYYPMKLRFRCR